MQSRWILGILLLAMLSFSISFSQNNINVPLGFHTTDDFGYLPEDTLFICVQIATDSLFENVVVDEEFSCKPDTDFTYLLDIEQSETQKVYWWRGKHKNQLGASSSWCPAWHFTFRWVETPSGCSLISPTKGEVIKKAR